MKIVRRSMISGAINTRDINVTSQQLAEWENGKLIQLAMPNLSDSDREFIMTGITDEEWESCMQEEDVE